MAWPDTVRESDLEISYTRGTGAGGQKRNKTSSKCRMRHIPTGITVECDETRSAHKNKEIAFRKLAEQLVPIMKGVSTKERNVSGATVVRTYNQKDQRVVDSRINKTFTYDSVIEENGLQKLIDEIIANVIE